MTRTLRPTVMPVLLGRQAYLQKLLNLYDIGLWAMNEASGTTAVDSSPEGNDGEYTGVDLANASGPDGVLVPYWDGANDYLDLYSAGLAADIDKAAGTFGIWIKPDGTDFTDGAIVELNFVNTANTIKIPPKLPDNWAFQYRQGATVVGVDVFPSTYGTGWQYWMMTWDTAADELKAYVNGSQVGTTQSGLAEPGGDLTTAAIGARNSVPELPSKGWFALAGLASRALTPAEAASAAKV